MQSIDPRDYESQPRHEPPAGYVCVLRDIESDLWRIEGARHPRDLIEDALAESGSRFGIEVVSILDTEDLAASEAMLYEQHQAQLSDAWLELDEYQLEALRRSVLQIDAHPSRYLTQSAPADAPKTPPAGQAGRRRRRDRWGLRRDRAGLRWDRAGLRPSGSARQPLFRAYGAKSLKSYKEQEAPDWREGLDSPQRLALSISERLENFRESDAGKALQVVLCLILSAILCVMDGCS
ncbi:MAG: hypothetical protein F4X02_06260 [Chloroflexi bacterium]|nr:hypothetical protein [Chloroflexota bacterium]